MKTLTRIALFAFVALFAQFVFAQDRTLATSDSPAYAPGHVSQDKNKDRIRLSLVYNRTDFPQLGMTIGQEVTENVNGFTAGADVKVFKAGGLRGSFEYNFKQAYNVEVYPDYFDGMKMMDLYRNVQTHAGLAQVEYVIKGRLGAFGGLGYGTRKIHTDAPRQTLRFWRVGVMVPFSEGSPLFIKGYIDFERPYGTLPAGFVNPATRTLSVGGGIRF